MPTHSCTFAIGRVSCSADGPVVVESSVFRINPDSYRDAEKPANGNTENH